MIKEIPKPFKAIANFTIFLVLSVSCNYAAAETFVCDREANVYYSHSDQYGVIQNKNGLVMVDSKTQRRLDLFEQAKLIVKIKGKSVLHTSAGPDYPEIKFMRSGNLYIHPTRDWVIRIYDGPYPKMVRSDIEEGGLSFDMFACIRVE